MSRTNFETLLEAGCHFGHLKRKWNPAMAPYIFMERNGIHIIHIKWGWTGDYAAHLLSRFNDSKECSKIFSRCRLVAYRNCISIGDARHHLISAGKI